MQKAENFFTFEASEGGTGIKKLCAKSLFGHKKRYTL